MTMLGRKHSEETKEKIRKKKLEQGIVPKSAFKKGMVPWNKGVKCPYVTQRNLQDNPAKTGTEHWNWKGNAVKYQGLHKWVKKELGQPSECWYCEDKTLSHRQYHWANLSGEYRRDINDFARLCAKCHKALDSGKISASNIIVKVRNYS